MSTILDILERATEYARDMKQDRAKNEQDMPWACTVFRGNTMIAQLYPIPATADNLMHVVSMAAVGYSADVIAIIYDTWQLTGRAKSLTELGRHPITGEKLKQGDLQDLVENHFGRENGWVTDALMVSVYNRAGDAADQILNYRMGYRKVIWDEAVRLDNRIPDQRLMGAIPEFIAEVMNDTTIAQAACRDGLSPDVVGISAEEAVAMSDLTITKMLTGRTPTPPGFPRAAVILGAPPGTEREKIIRQEIPDSKVITLQ